MINGESLVSIWPIFNPTIFLKKIFQIRDWKRLVKKVKRTEWLSRWSSILVRYLIMSRFSFRSRMKSYIDVFKDNGVFFDLPIAYYSGSRAIYEMYKSEDERDKENHGRVV